MKRKEYVKPSLYSKKVAITHILADSIEKSTDTTTGFGAKEGTGFDWGDTWSNNEESEN